MSPRNPWIRLSKTISHALRHAPWLGLTAFAVLIFSWAFSDQILDVTFGTLIVTAVNVLVVGLVADLVDKRL